MNQLVQLFPEHAPQDLQYHLDRAGGDLQSAIEALLDPSSEVNAAETEAAPSPAVVPCQTPNSLPPTSAVSQRIAGKQPAYLVEQARQHKKFKMQHSIDLTNDPIDVDQMFDLTQDSSDEDSHANSRQGHALSDSWRPYHFTFGESATTWNPSSSESMGTWRPPNSPSSSVAHLQNGTLHHPTYPQPQLQSQLPPQQTSASASEAPHLPSFEDFHLEQERLKEEEARRAAEIEQQKTLLVANFISIAKDMFEDISVSYLMDLIQETRPKFSSDDELVDACIDTIFKLKGQYPKSKSKRRRKDDDEEGDSERDDNDNNAGEGSSGSNSQAQQRDFMDCKTLMHAAYETQCATQMFQDFPMIQATSIRACLKKFNFHYAPTFEYLSNIWTDHESGKGGTLHAGDIKLAMMTKPRTKKNPTKLIKLDPDFRKELEWVQTKVAKELKEIEEAEEEQRNYEHYKELDELIEWRAAEVELGYRRTVLKCMSDGCTAVFADCEAAKFLSKPVFQGLLRARQQSELKMAGLDSLVECPFCTYAAVVENDEDKEFRCEAPKCRKVSCRFCKAPTHIPLSCEEYRKEQEKNNVLSAQHQVEEQMSQALIRECPKCKSKFFKTEVCRLWDNTIERNENDVKEAAQKMIRELRTDKPDLAAQIKLDIPK
ncbi:hypothetical protein EDD11_001740 [Mortierella claussenii]|nr:hypothetical protein EDD11_001740 [Mortierella claussenii]